jgi:hypothetical protein
MPKPEIKNKQARPASLDVVDILFWAGLVCLLVGLGLAAGWGWGLAVVGGILTGYAIWLSTPASPPKEGK